MSDTSRRRGWNLATALLCLATCLNIGWFAACDVADGVFGNKASPAAASPLLPPAPQYTTVAWPGTLQVVGNELTGVRSGDLRLRYTLKDPDSNPADVTVEFQDAPGAAWRTASPAAASPGTAGLSTSPTGETHEFVWDSVRDLPGAWRNDVRVRVKAPRGPGLSAPFPLNNAAKPPATLDRQPWIQSVFPDSVTILWATNELATDAVVQYGTTPELGSTAYGSGLGKAFTVTITGLAPGTTYYYRVLSNNRALSSGDRFDTAPTQAVDFRFAAIGDSGDGSPEQYALGGLLAQMDPDILLHTGDVAYPNGDDGLYPNVFFGPYQDYLRRRPIWPTLGNHEMYHLGAIVSTLLGQSHPDYLDIFHLPTNNPEGSERYYAFDWGDVHFVSMDTSWVYNSNGWGFTTGTDSVKWLRNDLAATQKTWKVVYTHVAPYSSGKHGKDGATTTVRDVLGPILDAYHVDLVVCGHDHNYERTSPTLSSNAPHAGIVPVYVVTGGGGGPNTLRDVGTESWTVVSEKVTHLVEFQVRIGPPGARSITATAYRTDRSTVDSFTLTK